ncbi:NAD(+)/NADH kinase [Halocalculus aciditolerans]|uniref:ATP-NAD kinase n=1 Tax=Halocalculus aciditolerans TaxID=1383812 RepID=A0A830FC03_9EURY|nr:NAD(+)/NADH kinase [Halocalculus aciditolerans]GGL60062.1 hypothetical protein GCM10009039_17910 [Halocalculus aciditolerans]
MDRVAVVGEGSGEAVALVEDHGASGRAVDAGAVGSYDAAVALGEEALLDVVHADAATPVLPVGAGRGYEGVPRESLPQAVAALVEGDTGTRERATLTVSAGDSSYRALADVMLVTAEVAEISEYGVHTRNATVDEVRADGLLVATPTGSRGYNAAADGPVVEPGAPVVSVVPIAPFRIDHTDWVLSPPLDLTIERDETPVTLLVDRDDVGPLDPDTPVHVEAGRPVELLTTGESRGFYE